MENTEKNRETTSTQNSQQNSQRDTQQKDRSKSTNDAVNRNEPRGDEDWDTTDTNSQNAVRKNDTITDVDARRPRDTHGEQSVMDDTDARVTPATP